ncbi:MAG: hypothetical protein DRI65_04390 [Chloroflexota bacterium]|nr:MAG: hypothetical protein DRI65_04390 [Chloroflexota bacterium]
MDNYIVCAALRLGDTVIAGPRHFDSVMRSQITAIMKPEDKKSIFAGAEQGFVDKYGDFWNRIDAMVIVLANNQAIDLKRNGSKTELFSEGLY